MAGYLIDMRDSGLNQPPDWLVLTVDIYAWAIVPIILLYPIGRRLASIAVRRLARLRLLQVICRLGGERRGDPLDRAATAAAYLSVAYVAIVIATSGILASRTRDEWEPTTPTFVVVAATLTSLTITTIALIAQLRALPRGAAASPADNQPTSATQ